MPALFTRPGVRKQSRRSERRGAGSDAENLPRARRRSTERNGAAAGCANRAEGVESRAPERRDRRQSGNACVQASGRQRGAHPRKGPGVSAAVMIHHRTDAMRRGAGRLVARRLPAMGHRHTGFAVGARTAQGIAERGAHCPCNWQPGQQKQHDHADNPLAQLAHHLSIPAYPRPPARSRQLSNLHPSKPQSVCDHRHGAERHRRARDDGAQ